MSNEAIGAREGEEPVPGVVVHSRLLRLLQTDFGR